jgi:hypothetical protein
LYSTYAKNETSPNISKVTRSFSEAGTLLLLLLSSRSTLADLYLSRIKSRPFYFNKFDKSHTNSFRWDQYILARRETMKFITIQIAKIAKS